MRKKFVVKNCHFKKKVYFDAENELNKLTI